MNTTTEATNITTTVTNSENARNIGAQIEKYNYMVMVFVFLAIPLAILVLVLVFSTQIRGAVRNSIEENADLQPGPAPQ